MDGGLKMSARDKRRKTEIVFFFLAHTNAQAHAPDTAAVKAITKIQTCLWENSVGFCWSTK